jgi:biopolymer transport protein ExbD
MVIPGSLVFHYAWRYDHRSQGLYVAVGLSPMLKNFTCGESWTVRIDSREIWYLNSTKTSQNELAGVLSQKLRDNMNGAVYLDVDPSLPYAVAIEAIDTIQKTRAKVVVLLTPKTKKVSVP